jgi:hypothetical protein
VRVQHYTSELKVDAETALDDLLAEDGAVRTRTTPCLQCRRADSRSTAELLLLLLLLLLLQALSQFDIIFVNLAQFSSMDGGEEKEPSSPG